MAKTTTCTILLLSLAVLLGWVGQARGQQSDPREKTLIVLEHLWNEAQVNRDAAALDGLIAPRFTDTEWDGEISDKSKFLADIRDPLFKPSSLNIQDLNVNFFGNTAVITGIYHTKGSYQGRPYDHVGRFTDTWIFENGRWLCVASHTSLIKK